MSRASRVNWANQTYPFPNSSGSGSASSGAGTVISGLSNTVTTAFTRYYADTSGVKGNAAITVPNGSVDGQALMVELALGAGSVTLNAPGNTLQYNGAYTNQIILSGIGSSVTLNWVAALGVWA